MPQLCAHHGAGALALSRSRPFSKEVSVLRLQFCSLMHRAASGALDAICCGAKHARAPANQFCEALRILQGTRTESSSQERRSLSSECIGRERQEEAEPAQRMGWCRHSHATGRQSSQPTRIHAAAPATLTPCMAPRCCRYWASKGEKDGANPMKVSLPCLWRADAGTLASLATTGGWPCAVHTVPLKPGLGTTHKWRSAQGSDQCLCVTYSPGVCRTLWPSLAWLPSSSPSSSCSSPSALAPLIPQCTDKQPRQRKASELDCAPAELQEVKSAVAMQRVEICKALYKPECVANRDTESSEG